jgi:hypothetical protein
LHFLVQSQQYLKLNSLHLVVVVQVVKHFLEHLEESLLLEHQREQGTFAQPLD